MGREIKLTCDLTGQPIAKGETNYSVTFIRRDDGKPNQFQKAENCVISHAGLQMFLKNGFQPEWKMWQKDANGKWNQNG